MRQLVPDQVLSSVLDIDLVALKAEDQGFVDRPR